MNTAVIFTGVLSCLLLMLIVTHPYTVSGNIVDEEHLSLIAHPSAAAPNKIVSIYNDESMIDNSDEHEFEKRRFNAWAGKRNLLAKRRFNAWAGRR